MSTEFKQPFQIAARNKFSGTRHGKNRFLVRVHFVHGLALLQNHVRKVKILPEQPDVAVAALAEYEAPMILMDLGTATTIEVVEPNNMYLGGIIFPGVRVSLDALTSRTAQLPGISLDKPKHVIGKNTVDCMRSGMMYGTAAMLDGLVERIEAELGHKSTLIATGGLAQFITPLCKREIILEKDLLLKGLNVIYKKNKR